MAKKPTVIDLSHYQGIVDLKSAQADGILGVIHKATEGTTWTDGDYQERKAECAALGLAFAAYHFLKPGNIPQQIAHFINFAQPPKGGRVFIDYEDNALKLTDLKTAIAAIEALDATLQIGIYAGNLIKVQLGSGPADATLAKYPLWLAQYTTATPSWPKKTWPVWSLWQFTDSANVQGVGLCDGNVFNGSNEGLLKFLNPIAVEPPPVVVDPPPGEITISVNNLPPGCTVELFVNGEPYR